MVSTLRFKSSTSPCVSDFFVGFRLLAFCAAFGFEAYLSSGAIAFGPLRLGCMTFVALQGPETRNPEDLWV